MAWTFAEKDICQGTISCIRNPGSKDVWIDVLEISENTRFKLYACAEGEELTSEDLVCETSDLEDTIDLSDCIAEIFQFHGNGTGIVIGLANWGSRNIRLQQDCLGLFYVKDHGECFGVLDIPGSDGRTVYPGSMAMISVDNLGEGNTSLELAEIILSPDGGSGGCSAAGGLHLVVLLGLPLLVILSRKR